MWQYYLRWIKISLTHSLGPIDLWAGLAGVGLAIVDHFIPEKQLTALAWQLPVWTAASVIVVRLLAAPYWMDKEHVARASAAKSLVNGHLRLAREPQLLCDFIDIKGETFIEKVRMRLDLLNASSAAIAYTIFDFKTVVENQIAPHDKAYPSKGIVLSPGETVSFNADLLHLKNVRCGRVAGECHFDINYGPPGDESCKFSRGAHFKIELDPATCDVQNQTCSIRRQTWTWITE